MQICSQSAVTSYLQSAIVHCVCVCVSGTAGLTVSVLAGENSLTCETKTNSEMKVRFFGQNVPIIPSTVRRNVNIHRFLSQLFMLSLAMEELTFLTLNLKKDNAVVDQFDIPCLRGRLRDNSLSQDLLLGEHAH